MKKIEKFSIEKESLDAANKRNMELGLLSSLGGGDSSSNDDEEFIEGL